MTKKSTEQDELNAAVREWDKKTKARAQANKKAKEASAEANEAKAKVEAILGERGYDGVKVGGSLVSLYDTPYAHVTDREAFRKWAAKQDEAYFEPEARVRQELINRIARDIDSTGEAPPPGLKIHRETKISKRKA